MGCYDEVEIPCPMCGWVYIEQSKGGDCGLDRYNLSNVPLDVLGGIGKHKRFTCGNCGQLYGIDYRLVAFAVPVIADYSGHDD